MPRLVFVRTARAAQHVAAALLGKRPRRVVQHFHAAGQPTPLGGGKTGNLPLFGDHAFGSAGAVARLSGQAEHGEHGKCSIEPVHVPMYSTAWVIARLRPSLPSATAPVRIKVQLAEGEPAGKPASRRARWTRADSPASKKFPAGMSANASPAVSSGFTARTSRARIAASSWRPSSS